MIRILTFALFDRAASRTVDDLCASPWSLSHHLVKVNCRVRVVQVVVREEFRLVFVSEGLRTSFQVWITVTNLKKIVFEKENKKQYRADQSLSTGNKAIHTGIRQCDVG